jgi:hypothetical protein
MGRNWHGWRDPEAVVRTVGDADVVRAMGREPEDAPTWTEVDRSGLSAVRCL